MTFSNRNQYSLDDNEKLASKMQVEQIDMIIHKSLKSFLVFLFSFFSHNTILSKTNSNE
jgi:hypothetical protein